MKISMGTIGLAFDVRSIGRIAFGALIAIASLSFSPIKADAAVGGSYQQSCNNIVDDGTTVRANCKKKNGSYVATSLAYRICQGDISNNDGKLTCTPKGSFKNSCSSISWNESFLTANCRKKNGQNLWNSGFNYNACLANNRDIANCDGSLHCGGC